MNKNIIGLTLIALFVSAVAVWYIGSISDGGLAERTAGQVETMARYERIKAFAEDWDKEAAYPPPYDALDPSVSLNAGANALFDPTDDYWGLPRSEGYDLVDGYCTACHSIRIVMQQRADRARWDELLTWMVKKQGMPEINPADREQVLTYLSTEFNN